MSKEETHQEKVLKLLENQTKHIESQTEILKAIQNSLSPKPQTTPTPSTSDSKPVEKESPKHWTAEEKWRDRNDCPDGKCVGEIEKLSKIWLQNFKKERENEPDICDPKKGGCGIGVNSKKEGECPLCGGRDAIPNPRKR